MTKKWTCSQKCYVSIGGVLKLRHPGDKAEGDIDKTAEKYFKAIEEKPLKPKIDPAVESERLAIKKELDAMEPKVSYHPSTGLDKLKVLLKTEKGKRAEG